ncbi:CHC2 zinc finger domain-containing protein [Salinivirga cyanobacteriivorans]|uniref:CHC2 zinc finger domain-containing protein n=1 Tax=Salinivirga cyanobacteriivorans TaxID=1307839 RepID=UPI002FFC6E19
MTIFNVSQNYGIKPDKNDHIKCPFHKDDKPSCKIYTDTNTYNCFGCGKTGDVIQFIQDKENCSKHAALKIATELANGNTTEHTQNTDVMGIASKRAAEAENFAELFNRQKEGLPRSPKAQEYLRNRCLEQLQEVGYNSGVNWKKLKQCITFPLKDKNGNIVSLYGRRITESNGHNAEFGKHYYTENRKGLYPHYPDKHTETLIITEAIIDAATLQLSIENNQYSILAAYGTNGLTAEHKAAISQLSNLQEVIFFFDGDTAGKQGATKYSEELRKDKACLVSTVTTPDGEDINSLFVNYGKEAILQLIEERQPVDLKASQLSNNLTIKQYSNQTKAATAAVQTVHALSPLKTDIPNKIIHQTPTARYIIKGSLPKTFDRMLVSLDVQHPETGIKYRCRLDLYEEKQTRKEAREASEKLDLRSDLVENDLSQLTDLLEEYRDNQLQQSTEENSNDKALRLPEQAKCKAFLQKEDLIQNLNELIGQSGIVGEENNRLFLFIIGTSHKMKDTLHALIQGSSGSGKTHLLSKIAALMPPERVVKFTRVTENSFYNYDEYFFRNKLICLEDIDGLKEEALFAWRELISNEQLSSSTSQKDENGNIRSAQRIVRGPMASICATTHGQIYEDNMSRMFIVAVDESSEQTQKIMNYQSKTASGTIEKKLEVEAKEFLQNSIRMLKPLKVINPYADKIKLPPQAHKIRRLHELFLSFVKQVTLIHQYQRKRDGQGRVITEPEDLKTAVEIMFDSIFLKVDELDGSLRQFYEELKNHIKTKSNPEQYEFMQREIRHALNISKSQLQRYINDLVELEYLQQMGGYQNRGYKYKILWWDDIAKLREDVKQYLKNQIDRLENNNQ